jgi:hypothetical protein
MIRLCGRHGDPRVVAAITITIIDTGIPNSTIARSTGRITVTVLSTVVGTKTSAIAPGAPLPAPGTLASRAVFWLFRISEEDGVSGLFLSEYFILFCFTKEHTRLFLSVL